MTDFSVESSLKTIRSSEEAPSALDVPEIVSPCETQSSEGSDVEKEKPVRPLYFRSLINTVIFKLHLLFL